MTESTSYTGPLFDGRAAQISADLVTQIETDVAQAGVNTVKQQLGQVLQHPTGHYESQIMVDRSSTDSTVTDNNVIYGPWLEGTDSRNQTTRFKGYGTFRKVAQQLSSQATALANKAVSAAVGRLNS